VHLTQQTMMTIVLVLPIFRLQLLDKQLQFVILHYTVFQLRLFNELHNGKQKWRSRRSARN